jgi:hypothetical protein
VVRQPGQVNGCAQEIAVLTARLGFQVDDNVPTVIQLYRSHTELKDIPINAFRGFCAFVRGLLRGKVTRRPAMARAVTPTEPL